MADEERGGRVVTVELSWAVPRLARPREAIRVKVFMVMMAGLGSLV